MDPIVKSIEMEKMLEKDYSYLEQHRIFELIQEMTAMLLLKKPDDHLLYLKQCVRHAARRLYSPRIIMIVPKNLDAQRVTARLSKKLKIPIITSKEVLSDDALILKHAPRCYAEAVIKSWKEIWSEHMKNNSDGWIFVASDDFGLNEHLANRLKYGGIVPTHVFAIVLSEEDSSDDYWINITGLKRAYKHLIKVIEGKKSRDIAEECLDLARRRYLFPRCDRSMRLLLLNFFKAELSEDLASQLAKECEFAHEIELNGLDFERIVAQVALQRTELGQKLREEKEKLVIDAPADLKIKAFEERLVQLNLLDKRWILTGVERVEDFKELDASIAPPNRVLMLVDSSAYDKVNSDKLLPWEAPEDREKQKQRQLMWHMKDALAYAGPSAEVIRLDCKCKTEDIVALILARLSEPGPFLPRRVGRAPTPPPRPEEIEYEPDDEPDVSVFAEIREPEPILPLI